jgi:acetoin utilization deacetylase AcuC-like enzyme
MKIKVVYNPKVVSESGSKISPSAGKPKLLAEQLQNDPLVEFVEPEPVTVEDILRCHDPQYVEDIITLKKPNGFGTRSQSVVDSLPWTNGAMY